MASISGLSVFPTRNAYFSFHNEERERENEANGQMIPNTRHKPLFTWGVRAVIKLNKPHARVNCLSMETGVSLHSVPQKTLCFNAHYHFKGRVCAARSFVVFL